VRQGLMSEADALFWLGFWHRLLAWGCVGMGVVLAFVCLGLSSVPKHRHLQRAILVVGLVVIAVGTVYSVFVTEAAFNIGWQDSGRPLVDYSPRHSTSKFQRRSRRPDEYLSGNSAAEWVVGLSIIGLVVTRLIFRGADNATPNLRKKGGGSQPRTRRKAVKPARQTRAAPAPDSSQPDSLGR
jgi:hypothetical protein